MKYSSLLRFGAFAAATASLGVHSNGLAASFTDNFDTDSSAQWVVNASGPAGSDRAIFAFDYSTVGVPSAPNSTGGSTRGLLLQANRTAGVFSGISVSPLGQSFTGDYVLRFDLWQNFNGPAPVGGSGSTQVSGAGIGTAGTTPQWAGATYDSLFFGTTGDGNSATDYRVYPVANVALEASGVYAAGTQAGARNNSDPYYANFGNLTPPAAQTALFPEQTGSSLVGSQAFAWHDVEIAKIGSTVTWTIDGKLIATVDASALAFGGANILLNHFDINANRSTDPNADSLLFGLFDNVSVTPVPEPSTYALVFGGLTLAGALLRRRMRA